MGLFDFLRKKTIQPKKDKGRDSGQYVSESNDPEVVEISFSIKYRFDGFDRDYFRRPEMDKAEIIEYENRCTETFGVGAFSLAEIQTIGGQMGLNVWKFCRWRQVSVKSRVNKDGSREIIDIEE